MATEIKISVIIPVYNAAELLRRTVESVMSQNFGGCEVVLVDDGSTDGSAGVCDELAAIYGNVKVLHKENGGVSSARNAGIAAADGEYVMFLDADDLLHRDSLLKMYRPGFDLVVGGFEKIVGSSVISCSVPREEDEYVGDSRICRFLDNVISEKECYLLNSSCFKLYRRSLLSEFGLVFNTSLDYGEDKMFVMNFLCHVQKVITISSVVYSYVLRADSLSSDESSDTHLFRLLKLMDVYVPVLERLNGRFSESVRVSELYHTDVVGRYVFRILTQFIKRRSTLLTEDNLRVLYRYMGKDTALGISNVRFAQIPNVLLYRLRKPSVSMCFYNLTARLFSLFKN